MKLYTEEQVRKAIRETRYYSDLIKPDNVILKELTPIELPSDEEIEQYATFAFPDAEKIGGETYTAYRGMKSGAKWMKEQILNQKK